MKFVMDILRGVVIGIANIIPGVSGGTMMVSMGIYDNLIHSITHIFKAFKKSVMTLLPYIIGMLVGIVGLAFVITYCLSTFPLPTNAMFIGLILGGLPIILGHIKGCKAGTLGIVLFAIFFALIILLQLTGGHDRALSIELNIGTILILMVVGIVAAATMVIPGVSGSMILMLLGYYSPVTGAVKGLTVALAAGDWATLLYNVGILLPFGVGVVLGIFGVAKLIEFLLSKWEGLTYCGILGLVAASPVAILMSTDMSGVKLVTILISIVTFAIGFLIAYKLAKMEPTAELKSK